MSDRCDPSGGNASQCQKEKRGSLRNLSQTREKRWETGEVEARLEERWNTEETKRKDLASWQSRRQTEGYQIVEQYANHRALLAVERLRAESLEGGHSPFYYSVPFPS
jgi:hypothetical protein